MKPVIWSANAERDRLSQLLYIAADNPSAAVRVGDLIEASTIRLAEYPESGRPGRVRGTRELVIARSPYVAIYRVSAKDVTILRFLHGAQRWPPRQSKR